MFYCERPFSVILRGEYSKLLVFKGHAVTQFVEAMCYKLEGRGFDYRWCQWNFLLT